MRFLAIIAAVSAAAGSALAASSGDCASGTSPHCCKSVDNGTETHSSGLLGLLDLGEITDLIGQGCAPLLDLASCALVPACCSENTQGLPSSTMSAPILASHPTLQVTPEPLTPESFSPFGTAISCPIPRDVASIPPLHTLSTQNPAPVVANQSTALKYSPVSPLLDHYAGSCASGKPSEARMSMFVCFPRKLRAVKSSQNANHAAEIFDVRILERHPFTTQTFIPLDLSSQSYAGWSEEPLFLVIVAPTRKGETATATDAEGRSVTIRDPPDLQNLRAFIARGGQAVTYGAGTWHAPMVVLGKRRVEFVVVQFLNGVDDEDCQLAAFGEGITVTLGRRAENSAKL
ncbi:hypothetical protein ASPZODRAFT_142860 [Penicilliopsis zonata CBS 506.65]|uniref:Ureidoglycolate hydrolase n=1 Tax=Penicilliopsis zonata CBS 506.65 TaxID=1073090 RepID=A0A1L9SGE5_9EURO|nr:hypothetical protein ASPZODRAFT_142860 [Penicilliopsis zonata CBS 506.65]OJJ46241.1 hypothetical protein ASPZODRAFT_142860 [Penicilliopsis zonata CBS 506.65]